MDLDHFKAINDFHGHAVGDAMLVHFARVLRTGVRMSDVTGRIGGEEFAVILPETDRRAAAQAAEKIRVAVETTPLVLESGDQIPMTVSLGIAAIDGANDPDAVMVAADQALYRAKAQGRNSVAA